MQTDQDDAAEYYDGGDRYEDDFDQWDAVEAG